MRLQRQKVFLLTASGLAVIGVATLGKTTIPLYDGVGFPDELYRYADQSHKPKTKPPDSPSLPFDPQTAQQQGLTLISSEQGPQLNVYIYPSSIELSQNVLYGTFSAKALAPTTEPSDGTIDGNVYRLSGSVNTGTFTIMKAADVGSYNSIELRLPQGFPADPTMEYKPSKDGTWHQLSTYKVGNDIYESPDLNNFGDYALVTLKKSEATHGSNVAKYRDPPYVAISMSVLVIAMAAIVTMIRLKQRTHQ